MDKARNLAIASVALGLIVVILITYQAGFSEVLELLAGASIIAVACYLVTSVLIAGMLTLKWKVILNAHGMDVPYTRLFTYRLVGYSVSYLTPSAHVGGEPIRAYFLQQERVPAGTAFSTVIVDKTIEIITDIVFFFFGVALILHSIASDQVKIVVLGVAILLILLLGIFLGGILSKRSMFVGVFRALRLNKVARLRHIEQNLADIEKQIELFYRHRKDSFLTILLIMALLWLLMFLEYRFLLLILGQIASPMQIFLILTGVGLAYSLPIPAAVGSLELGQLSAAKVLGLSAATAVGLSFIVRARDLIWTVIGLAILGVNRLSFSALSRETTAIDNDFSAGRLLSERKAIDIRAKRVSPRLRRILGRWKYQRLGKRWHWRR